MSSISVAERWLSEATGGHPVLVPALIIAGIVIILAVMAHSVVTSIIHPWLEKLGLRNRNRDFKSLRAITSTMADPEGPVVIASPSARCFLTLLPGRSERGRFTQEPFGRAYKIQDDGQIRELWRVEGWYSFHECFLSDDGRYLVRVIDSPGGSKVSRGDLAIAFYNRGKLLRQFSTSDLVRDGTNGRGWVSYYRGLVEPEVELSEPTFDLSDFGANTFRITTVDRIVYAFDITTGEIIPADVRLEHDGARLHKAIFVAGVCVAVGSVGVILALSRRRLK